MIDIQKQAAIVGGFEFNLLAIEQVRKLAEIKSAVIINNAKPHGRDFLYRSSWLLLAGNSMFRHRPPHSHAPATRLRA